jgi:AraC family transcriptional regulator of adaptative response/methylated-DNA-[protein]-cysteine methyltransferase
MNASAASICVVVRVPNRLLFLRVRVPVPEINAMEITYTTADCPLGRVLVAASPKGLCMVSIGRSYSALEDRLRSSFPTATVKRNDRAMAGMRRGVVRRISGKDLDEKMPLDLVGTPFQVAVWKEMLRIPAGRVASYADVARNIGRPKAFRAVAQACGANPVPVVVPCHRVVASGGKLGGYTGGIDKKLFLLSAEGVTSFEP